MQISHEHVQLKLTQQVTCLKTTWYQ